MRKPHKTPLSPTHFSKLKGRHLITPGDLSRITLPPGGNALLQEQALDIFTLCSNGGLTFGEALASILLTGINWGANAEEEPARKKDIIHVRPN